MGERGSQNDVASRAGGEAVGEAESAGSQAAPSRSASLGGRAQERIAKANAYHAAHPELVAEFNRLTNGECADGEGGVKWGAVRAWQNRYHSVNGMVADGLIGPKTIEVARTLASSNASERSAAGAAAPASGSKLASAPRQGSDEVAEHRHHARAAHPTPKRRRSGDAGTADAEQLYDLHFQLLHNATDLPHASKEQAIAALKGHVGNIAAWIHAGQDMHSSLARLHADSPVATAVSEGAAAVGEEAHEFWAWTKSMFRGQHGAHEKPQHVDDKIRLPGTEIWDLSLNLLNAARHLLAEGEVEEAIARLNDAAKAYRRAYQRLLEYKERTEGGAANAISALRVAEAAGAISFSVLTGGVGSGVVGTAAMAGLGAGGYAVAQVSAEQASEKAHGLREHIDWSEILKKGAEEAVTNFTGALVGGALSKFFLRKLGERLLMRLGKAEINALAARARMAGDALHPEVFVTKGWAFIANLAGGVGSTPVVTAVSTIVHGAVSGEWPKTREEFVHRVVDDLVHGAFFQVLLGTVSHAHETASAKGKGPGEGSGATFDPRIAKGEPPPAPPRPRQPGDTLHEPNQAHASEANAPRAETAAPATHGAKPAGVERLDPKRWTVEKAELDGTIKKDLLVDQHTGKKYLFKPNPDMVPVMRAEDYGITGGSIGGRAKAAEVAAKQLGIDTPEVMLVEHEGQVGSLQEWRAKPGAKSLSQIRMEDQAAYDRIVASPEYQRLRADLDTFDYLLNNLDRNDGNLIIELDAQGKVQNIVAIDHDLTFTREAKRFVDELGTWARDLPQKYSRPMYENLKRMKANPDGFRNAVRSFITPEEANSALKRLDVILHDIETKIATVGEAEAFHAQGNEAPAATKNAPSKATAAVAQESPKSADAGRAADKSLAKQERITDPVPGHYQGIDVDVIPHGWTITEESVTTDLRGVITARTEVYDAAGRRGYFQRAYDPATKQLTMKSAFLHPESPTWLTHDGVMMTPNGTPSQSFWTMRQMKRMGVGFGEVRKVKMASIQNVETILQLEQAKLQGRPLEDVLPHTASVRYADTPLTQAGTRIVPGSVKITAGERGTLEELLSAYEGSQHYGEARKAQNSKLLEKYGFSRNAEIEYDFDITFDVVPADPGSLK